MGDFNKLGLKKEILETLEIAGFTSSFDVQDIIVPLALRGKNIVFTSRTGSGKTLAYLLGHLSKINTKLAAQMIVLVPTRELAVQVGKELKKICDILDINVGVFFGGRDTAHDYKTFNKKNHIIVGTPGRVILHINDKAIKVGDVRYVVFDESDQMFDNGFYDDCAYLKTRISKDAQVILSSATITDKVRNFIEKKVVDYELLQIGDLIPKSIVQEKVYCEQLEKNSLLVSFFSKRPFKRALVFCNTKQKSTHIAAFLDEHKLKAAPLNGNMEQKERLKNLNLFKEGKLKIIVCTDVAARGLHIEHVDIVINYDAPTREEFYVHRIGRTGRVNNEGYALTLICPEDVERFKNLEFLYDLSVKELDKGKFLEEKKKVNKTTIKDS